HKGPVTVVRLPMDVFPRKTEWLRTSAPSFCTPSPASPSNDSLARGARSRMRKASMKAGAARNLFRSSTPLRPFLRNKFRAPVRAPALTNPLLGGGQNSSSGGHGEDVIAFGVLIESVSPELVQAPTAGAATQRQNV